jgi:hypothetical protein
MNSRSALFFKRGPLYIARWHWLRWLVDLHYATIFNEVVRAHSLTSSTRVLDFGSGMAPWKRIFKKSLYRTLDAFEDADFKSISEVPSEFKADVVLLLEVLEHVEDPSSVLRSIKTCLLDQTGELWLSVPFQARVHPCPKDFYRWTEDGLRKILIESGFEIIESRARGSDWALLCSKWIYFLSRRLYPLQTGTVLWGLLIGLIPLAAALGHLSLAFRFGYTDDTMGWFVRAKVRS